jgi:hypothetical protein
MAASRFFSLCIGSAAQRPGPVVKSVMGTPSRHARGTECRVGPWGNAAEIHTPSWRFTSILSTSSIAANSDVSCSVPDARLGIWKGWVESGHLKSGVIRLDIGEFMRRFVFDPESQRCHSTSRHSFG